MAPQERPANNSKGPDFFNLQLLIIWMGGFLGVAYLALLLFAAFAGSWSAFAADFASMTIWAFGLCAVGVSVGFLFGLPRVLTDTNATPPNEALPAEEARVAAALATEVRRTRLVANTNLEQVSDWLTKILVGVGLVELRNLHTYITELARIMAPSFGCAPRNESVATGVILVFSVGGFLIGYITTRAFLPKILQDAEVLAVEALERRAAAVTTLSAQIEPTRGSKNK